MDCRIDVNLPVHPKFLALRDRLGRNAELATIYLWLWVARCCPSGTIQYISRKILAQTVGYEGDPDKWVETLIELKLLDKTDNGSYHVHDWEDHNLFAATAPIRKKSAQKAANIRWEKRRKHKQKQVNNADRICASSEPAYTPSPSPSPNNKEKDVYGEFNNVFLTDDQFAKLKEKFGKDDAWRRIQKLSQYMASKGKHYKNHYATILSWDRRDERKQ